MRVRRGGPGDGRHADRTALRTPCADLGPRRTCIFTHDDDRLGPAGTAEWQAFVRDSEGNLVGLVEQRPQG